MMRLGLLSRAARRLQPSQFTVVKTSRCWQSSSGGPGDNRNNDVRRMLRPSPGRKGRTGSSPPSPEEEEAFRERQSSLRAALQQSTNSGGGGEGNSSAPSPTGLHDVVSVDEDADDYYAPELFDDKKYYWREEEYDLLLKNMGEDDPFERDEKGLIMWLNEADDAVEKKVSAKQEEERHYDESEEEFESNIFHDKDYMYDVQDEDDHVDDRKRGRFAKTDDRFDEHFFFNRSDLLTIGSADSSASLLHKRSENDFKVLPLREHGPDMIDFIEAVMEHPTDYASVSYTNTHPTSQREPKPDFPPNRAQPPLEFVEAHARFLYVSGLPPLEVNGEKGDLQNPLHRNSLQKTVAALFNVDSNRVFPANTTSAFVGLESPRELSNILKKGPKESFISVVPVISRPQDDLSDNELINNSEPGTVVLISKIPPGHTPTSLARELFPVDTEAWTYYGKDLSEQSFSFLSPTSVLVRFSSREQAEAVAGSESAMNRLQEFCRYPIQLFRARKELVHKGFSGPTKKNEVRVPGPRLIVDGDMPSKEFFLSHAAVVHVRGLDQTVTKAEISSAFDKYCTLSRDVNGSIEIVTCHSGRPTGKIYVGFDYPGEAEEAVRNMRGSLKLGGRTAKMKLVRNRKIPNRELVTTEKRPDRTEEELLRDLNNWEQHVDPADIKELEEAGVNKLVLDEALRSLRFHNPTFGALDSSLRTEALRPGSEMGGQYKQLVQMYVSTLKECIATPESVGKLYEAVHFPDEPIDLGIFDQETERQKKMNEKRSSPGFE